MAALMFQLFAVSDLLRSYERNSSINVTTSTNVDTWCTPRKLSIIVHGWNESCITPWVQNLTNNLNVHRQGCVFCLDYSTYSMLNYPDLTKHFNATVNALTKELNYFHQDLQFHPNDIYMFGFDFGAHVVLEAGRRFFASHGKLMKQIDVCEPRGNNRKYYGTPYSPRESAQNVQCIHVEVVRGTLTRDCHQNWNMANCGYGRVTKRADGICANLYNSAFTHKFPAIAKPRNCNSYRAASGNVLNDFNMGYLDALKYEGRFPQGKDFFANSYNEYPYNQPTNKTTKSTKRRTSG